MNVQAWRQCALTASLLWFSLSSFAIVMAPLPEVPSTTDKTATTTMPTNSVATQALIDQLFTKADYEDFAGQSSSTSFMNGDEP